ncbi:hypothetical protein KM043_012991 [Ampulex compressa]|nr:hypothetical protein KM043_012991 [Ampulex compressa]
MNTHQAAENFQADPKAGDVSKYNLRCNRNISEKMTKKDFVYDIRRPIQATRKFEIQRRPIVLPIQLRRKQTVDSKMPQYTVISEKEEQADNMDTTALSSGEQLSEERHLQFQCNFCSASIATMHSLSTHVKLHRRRYCKTCYWILEESETLEDHDEHRHRITPDATTNL